MHNPRVNRVNSANDQPGDLGQPSHNGTQFDNRFLSVGCWNAQSVRNKSAIFLNVLQEHKFQVVSLCETWHMDHDDIALKKITPDGYKCIEAARPRLSAADGRKKGNACSHGGVALIYRDNFCAKKISFDIKPSTFEVIAAQLSSVKANTVFIVVYRPGSTAINDLFFEELTTILEATTVYNSNLVITGDFNIHVDDFENTHSKRFKQLLDSFDLVQSVTQSTHTAGHTLDLVITRKDLPKPHVMVDLPQLSDHSLVRFQLPVLRPPLQYKDVSSRAWKGFDAALFQQDLLSSLLCQPIEFYEGFSVDQLQELYDTTLSTLLDKHAPKRLIRKRYQPLTPWFDADCAASRRKTRALERKYRRSKTSCDRLEWTRQMRTMHQLYTQKQNLYWENKVADSRGNPKKLWNTLSSVMGKRRVTSSFSSLDELSAEGFSKAFVDKIESVRASTSTASKPDFSGLQCASLFENFQNLEEDFVFKLITDSPNKNCQLDPVPTWVVKQFARDLLPFITLLCNTSLRDGEFPTTQKCALVTPVLKKVKFGRW